jgi:EAL domain-containing protein (putative c-di-GMP-specific phosphodiesterase class I)
MSRCKTLLDRGGPPDFAHFINLSPQFLARRPLVEELLQNAKTYAESCKLGEGAAHPLVLEITERQRIGNLDTLRADLQPLLDFGFRLALDDFGSGYSSFMYLANLPISFLKIEGWLVLNMRREHKIASVVESMAHFARKEGIKTIAEHVEDAETAHILRDMGVNWGQGWYFGRPQSH